MELSKIIIAVDGYSSTGKSSFARAIADKFGLLHLDSGAIYRAVTLHAIRTGLIDYRNRISEDALMESLHDLKITLRPQVYIGEENVEGQIRQMQVSNSVSPISALPFVRRFVDDILRSYGRKGGIVMDGRDIGTNVFPQAHLKIFMVAQMHERAMRRYNEMQKAGKRVTLEDVINNIIERDNLDSNRTVAPLRQAPDALVLDNTNMTMEQELEWIEAILKERFGIVRQ
ncbi:MAG: (d)CMP kinase [Bacteroidales bacterium]|nr:(d)CMP kinase [Bacteroidales bacterium]